MLFRLHDGVSSAEADAFVAALRALASQPGVVAWHIERSLDTRKGTVMIEDATFVDADAYETFRVDPAHRAVAERAATMSDWWVGDYAD